jgi:hypothetical protein
MRTKSGSAPSTARRDDFSAYEPRMGERPVCHPAPVSSCLEWTRACRWCGVSRIVKTSQSRGRLSVPCFAADRRNPSLRSSLTVCYTEAIRLASGTRSWRARRQPGCAVPPGLASKPYATRHCRAGLQAVPSLRDYFVAARKWHCHRPPFSPGVRNF